MRERITSTALSTFAVFVVLIVALAGTAPANAQDDENLITASSVAGVDVGATLDELRVMLDAYQVSDEMRLTVDLRGHTVSQDGRVVFRAAQVVPGSPQIELFIVSADTYRTAEGVGPGTSIDDAVRQYGRATFMLDRSNSGREFVVFEDQPDGPIAFRTYGIAGAYVGTYAGDATVTTSYQDEAAIASVWIGCTSSKACIRAGATVNAEDEAVAEQAAEDARAAAEEEAVEKAAEEAREEARAAEEKAAEEAASEEANAAEETASEDAAQTQAKAQSNEELAKTGTAQTRQIAVVSVLAFFGVSLLILERRFGLGPNWLD